ncbi:MAG: hypothetical protein PHU23_17205, partial [Dehalococcoidales bacterium]|nr:hypothetical protein [Dehalococcoidales bacterium]
MKKFIIPALVAVLIILQFVSLARIGSLQDELMNTRNELRNFMSQQSGHMSSQINSIYSGIDDMLKKQASIISSYDCEFGVVDTANLTLPVTFQIVPREIKEDTSVALYVSGESFAMSRSGTSFTATVPASIFSTLEARVAIEDGGVTRTEDLPVQDDLRYRALPIVDARFENIDGSYSKNPDGQSGEYTISGRIGMDVKPAMNGNTIEQARVVIDRDGTIVYDKTLASGLWNTTGDNPDLHADQPVRIGGGTAFLDIAEKFTISTGQSLTFTVSAVESLGLTHQEKFVLVAGANPVMDLKMRSLEDTTIIGKNGEVLYD